MRQFLLLLLSSILTLGFGQSIKGTLNDNSLPVAYANVMLHNAKDSSLIKFTYSDDNGLFTFAHIKEGNYFLKATFVGLDDFTSNAFTVLSDDLDFGTISMSATSNKISEVTITAKKPLMEVKPDRIVLNVAGSVLATGDDALSLLRKAPGVLVDNNENITLLGKTGLVIYIDGKPSPLSSADLANMLKNMSSNDIESIEIISNPSAKYEAQGTAGIINIKRKKLNNAGVNGSATVTGRQGKTSGLSSSLNLNFRNQKFNIAANGGFYNSHNFNYNDFYREQNNLGFKTLNENRNNSIGLNSKISADYYVNKKSTLGIIAEHSEGTDQMTNNSITKLGNILVSRTDSLLLNNGNTKANSNNTNLNANYYFDGGNETTFNIDLNYGKYIRENNSYTPNKYTNVEGSKVTSSYEVRSITPTEIDIMNLKMDYERKLGKGKISGGLKSALVKTDNSFNFYNINEGTEILNQNLSNRFKYNEWVNAGYINYNLQGKKLGFNAGIRIENSNTKGDLIAMNPVNNKLVKRDYTNVFPSAGLSFTPSKKHSFQLSYGRRINRPNYKDLNPFEFQLDQLTFEKGNPFLNPEYTDNIQLTHNFAQKLTTTLSYSHTTNVITRLVDTSGIKGTFITWDNIAYRKVYSVGVGAPFSITEKWSTYTNLNGVHTRNYADFGNGKAININVSSFNMYHQQSFSLSKGWSTEVNGWYNSPSLWEGTFVMKAMWAAGAGISKKFAGNSAKITLNIDDIFKTNIWSGESTYGGLYMNVMGGWDSRRARMTFSYNFGKQTKGKSRKRNTGLEDEQNRIK
ncbi:MAG: TonB-dependent receptor [Saprospiraceae bacterium]|jgi:outer membrane receptor protein involved in Fe transport